MRNAFLCLVQVSSMKSLICTDELATDVTGAEALIERHNEHRTEIDARTNTFQVRLPTFLVLIAMRGKMLNLFKFLKCWK